MSAVTDRSCDGDGDGRARAAAAVTATGSEERGPRRERRARAATATATGERGRLRQRRRGGAKSAGRDGREERDGDGERRARAMVELAGDGESAEQDLLSPACRCASLASVPRDSMGYSPFRARALASSRLFGRIGPILFSALTRDRKHFLAFPH